MSDIQVVDHRQCRAVGRAGRCEPRGVVSRRNLFDPQIMRQAAIDALRKLDPRVQIKNPVMFVVLVGTVVTLIYSIANPSVFAWSVTVWLALTVLFANFAEAMAEGRGKAQADTLAQDAHQHRRPAALAERW